MVNNRITENYARALAELEGDDFQAEVCARMASVCLGFQTVPPMPHGDGGLDGLSHDGQHGYCCYGPQHETFKTNAARVSAIVKKFTGDLRRLFELTTKGKKELVHAENAELGKILPKGQRLIQIQLIVNWFESHSIIGPISTRVAECKRASLCRYVNPNVDVIIIGPKELANKYSVDELTLSRVRHRMFVEKIEETAQVVAIGDPRSFDRKMEVLRELRPDQSDAIAVLAENFRSDWRMALAHELLLGDTVPTQHQALERCRKQIATRVTTLMLKSSEPWAQLDCATEIAHQTLEADFGSLHGSLARTVANGEVARLIGECPIGWGKRVKPNA